MKLNSNKLYSVFENAFNEIAPIYGKRETKSILYLLFENLFKLTKIDILTNRDKLLTEGDIVKVIKAVKRLSNNEPIQYIIGKSEFCGIDFSVTKAVLIPRQESEELVYNIVNHKREKKDGLEILDICSGSGCISISLKKLIAGSQVSAIEISKEAIDIARKNASDNQCEIDFRHEDIFNIDLENQKWDIIVSNPPYVRELEKVKMSANVIEHEPELALFVDDKTPLIFYKEITKIASKHLKKGGELWFEINEAFGDECAELLEQHSFCKIKTIKDIHNRDRFVYGIIPV